MSFALFGSRVGELGMQRGIIIFGANGRPTETWQREMHRNCFVRGLLVTMLEGI